MSAISLLLLTARLRLDDPDCFLIVSAHFLAASMHLLNKVRYSSY